jgi:cytochrome c-type biogenesis protein CcmF
LNLGDLLLGGAAIAALACCLTAALQSRYPRYERISRLSSYALFLLLSGALLLLGTAFLTSDLSYRYVWSHSSTDLAAGYKLVAVWAGGQGGIMLWAWFMAAALALETYWEGRRAFGPAYRRAFRSIGSALLLVFALVLVASGLFASTTPMELAAAPNGLGMNLALQSPEMAVHPPVVFAGYAFCLMLFAASIAHMLFPADPWKKQLLPWARTTFLLLSVGIAIGGIWAYYELGWGGFWAWDPVETASLVPWLVLAALLHAHSRSEQHPVLVPVLGALSFVAVLFSAFLTRTGGLWGSSVHTYGSSLQGTVGERLLTVLSSDQGVAGFFVLMLAMLVITALVAFRHRREQRIRGAVRLDEGTYLMLATVGVLTFITAFLVLLLVKNAGLDQSSNFAEYTEKVGLLSIAISSLLVFSSCRRFADVRRSAVICALIILGSAVLALFGAVTGAYYWLLAMVLPSYVLALSLISYLFMGRRGTRRSRAMRGGASLIHLGVLLVLIGFMTSTILAAVPAQGYPAPLAPGGSVAVGGYTIHLISVNQTQNGAGSNIVLSAQMDIYSGTSLIESIVLVNEYPADGGGRLRGDVYVHKTLAEDLYISFDRMTESEVLVEAKVVPLVNLVWMGALMLGAGLVVRMAASRGSLT